MAHLDLELSADLIRAIRRLAEQHYESASESSVSQVVEAALSMRLHWLAVAGHAGGEIDEPITSWVQSVAADGDGTRTGLPDWLFGTEGKS